MKHGGRVRMLVVCLYRRPMILQALLQTPCINFWNNCILNLTLNITEASFPPFQARYIIPMQGGGFAQTPLPVLNCVHSYVTGSLKAAWKILQVGQASSWSAWYHWLLRRSYAGVPSRGPTCSPSEPGVEQC